MALASRFIPRPDCGSRRSADLAGRAVALSGDIPTIFDARLARHHRLVGTWVAACAPSAATFTRPQVRRHIERVFGAAVRDILHPVDLADLRVTVLGGDEVLPSALVVTCDSVGQLDLGWIEDSDAPISWRAAAYAAVEAMLGRVRREEDAGEGEVNADPLLAAGLRLAHGFDVRLASLPIALAGAIFQPFGMVVATPAPDQEQMDEYVAHGMRQLERKLRAFIDAQLTKAVGANWVRQRVSKPVREKWEAAREADKAAGRPAAALIEYADFGEYRSIITQGDNWRDAFEAVFGRKEAIGELLTRLGAVRNPSAHVRPVSVEDVLTLRVDGRRLYVWMGEIVP